MAKKNETEDVQVVKKKPRGGNSPVIGMNGYDLEPGDNTKYLTLNIELFNLEKIDLHDEEAVTRRLEEYFQIYAKYDTKPTVAGMAMALGMNRRTLIAIVNDYATGGAGYKTALPHEVALVIKKAYSLLEVLWENYSSNGKINPVMAIFLAKNNYGYQDKTEYVLTPNSQQDSDYDADSIRKRYLIDSASDSDEDDNDSGND
ncbi:DNA-packaging protein [Anaerotruncus sp. DFI.9.16]|uniref:DNA-packaging protein n=1 Tax=Anaerotruncus sp. DFI.9.16 TaxID=2965275 RepID=UPI002108EA6F|nr:DNA-packaging protein [Anaerotruncus sp. DFI.9.16]MCQ4894932.1 DNA-packaging protein [Anaerotruncus sp. DFI.9.16]